MALDCVVKIENSTKKLLFTFVRRDTNVLFFFKKLFIHALNGILIPCIQLCLCVKKQNVVMWIKKNQITHTKSYIPMSSSVLLYTTRGLLIFSTSSHLNTIYIWHSKKIIYCVHMTRLILAFSVFYLIKNVCSNYK